MKLTRIIAALALPLLLCSCFLIPGAFTSSMDVRKDGTFTFTYKGELLFQSPDQIMSEGKSEPRTFSESKTTCYKDGGGEPYYDEYGSDPAVKEAAQQAVDAALAASKEAGADGPVTRDDLSQEDGIRPCTRTEIAGLRKTFDDEQASRAASTKKEAGEFAAMFGFNPADDDANRKLAATMMKYDGWKSVTYRGKGVFDVDYALTSKAGHDYIFPIIPHAGDIIVPFVALRMRDGGAVMVHTPALVGGGLRALAARAKAVGASSGKDMPQASQVTRGTFTLTTDADILTNNTDDGPSADPRGKKLVWEIGPGSEKIPEALIKLK